jgi:trehalose-phosphatase
MILLMLDYDGTLAPIVAEPAQAQLGKGILPILRRLSLRNDVVVAIISGRSLADIKNRVKLDSFYYAGCHGAEMEGPGWSYLHPKMKQIAGQAAQLEKFLAEGLTKINGCIIENKNYALTVHFRKVKSELWAAVEATVRQAEVCFSKWFKLEPGRKIYEFKPAFDWDKGKAVEMLIRLYQTDDPYPIYIGDDLTDESVFNFLQGKGLSILVDNKERPYKTLAVLRMHSVNQVRQFLQSLV